MLHLELYMYEHVLQALIITCLHAALQFTWLANNTQDFNRSCKNYIFF